MPEPIPTSRVHRFGDHVDTDQIIPARHLVTIDAAELAEHCMEDADPGFATRVQPGDVIVAGRNFGCGSSREHAPIAILGAGVRAVIADSFPRIFFRNAINVGLPVLESPEAAAALQAGAEIKVDLATGRIVDVATGRTFQAAPLPEICAEITAAGGLMGWVRQRLEGRAGVAGGAR